MNISIEVGLRTLYKKVQERIDPEKSSIKLPQLYRSARVYLEDLKRDFNKRMQVERLVNLEEELKTKYYSSDFREFFLEEMEGVQIETQSKNYLLRVRTLRQYLSEFEDDKIRLTDQNLDRFSILLGFEGYYDALYHRFDIQFKIDNTSGVPEVVNEFSRLISTKYSLFESLRELLVEIIVTENFNKIRFLRRIESLSSPINSKGQFQWYHRELITSSLAISVLNKWDLEKVELLIALLENDTEPLVFQRSIVGILLALISSFREESRFTATLELLKEKHAYGTFADWIFRILFFLYKNSLNPPTGQVQHLRIDYLYRSNLRYWSPQPEFTRDNIPHEDELFQPLQFKEDVRNYFHHVNELVLFDNVVNELIAMLRSDLDCTHELHTIKLRFQRKVNGKRKLEWADAWKVDQLIFSAYHELASGFISSTIGSLGSNGKVFLPPPLRDISQEFIQAIYQAFPCNDYVRLLDLDFVLSHPRFDNASEYKSQGDFLRQLTDGTIEDFKRAIICYEKALEIEPKDYQSLNGIGYSYLQIAYLKNEEEAFLEANHWFDLILNGYDKKYDINRLTMRQRFIAYTGRGICALELALLQSDPKLINDAIDSFKSALKLEDFNICIMYDLGRCYLEKSRLANDAVHLNNAIEWYDKTLEFYEQDAYAIHMKGRCYALKAELLDRTQDYNEASRLFNEAYKLDREDSESLEFMGDHWKALSENPDFDMPSVLRQQAKEWYRKSLEINPNNKIVMEKMKELDHA